MPNFHYLDNKQMPAPSVLFRTSFKPLQKGCHHTLIGWEGNAPKLLPLLNQESVSTTLCTGDLQLFLRDFGKSAPNKER